MRSPSRQRGRTRVWTFLLAQVLILAGLFALAEVLVRWRVSAIPPSAVPSGVEKPPYLNNPGTVISPRVFGSRLKYRINRDGLRGPEVSPDKGSGRRILILGDSVVFGAMVGPEGTFSSRLQGMLGGRDRWEVLNAGAGGYDVWDYEGFLELKGLGLEPDIVIIGLYVNDHIQRKDYAETTKARSAPNRRFLAAVRDILLRSELVRTALEHFTARQSAKSPALAVPKPLKPEDHEAIGSFFPCDPGTAEAVKRYLEEYRYDPSLVKDALPWLLDTKAWEAAAGPLAGIRRVCREKGIRVMAVVFPAQFELYPGYVWPEPHRTIGRLLSSAGIPFVDLGPVFAREGRGDELYEHRYDYAHPNARAYDWAAAAVKKELASLGWLKD